MQVIRDEVNNYRSMGGETETIPVECPYCHQLVAADVTPEIKDDPNKLRSLAIEVCTCPESQYERKHRKRVERLEDEIGYSIGKYSDNPLSQEICDSIQAVARQVCFKNVMSATIKISKKEKVTLRIDSKGNLIIERELKNVKSRTV